MTEEKKTKMEKNYSLCVLWQVYILLIVVPNFREKYHENNNNNNTFIYVALVPLLKALTIIQNHTLLIKNLPIYNHILLYDT